MINEKWWNGTGWRLSQRCTQFVRIFLNIIEAVQLHRFRIRKHVHWRRRRRNFFVSLIRARKKNWIANGQNSHWRRALIEIGNFFCVGCSIYLRQKSSLSMLRLLVINAGSIRNRINRPTLNFKMHSYSWVFESSIKQKKTLFSFFWK